MPPRPYRRAVIVLLGWLEQVSLPWRDERNFALGFYSHRGTPDGCFAYELWDLRVAHGDTSTDTFSEFAIATIARMGSQTRDDGVFSQIELGGKKTVPSLFPLSLFPSELTILTFPLAGQRYIVFLSFLAHIRDILANILHDIWALYTRLRAIFLATVRFSRLTLSELLFRKNKRTSDIRRILILFARFFPYNCWN